MNRWRGLLKVIAIAGIVMGGTTMAEAACFASYAEGGVILTKIGSPTGPVMHASSDATVYDYLGNIDTGCQINGSLRIICSETGVEYASVSGISFGVIQLVTRYETYGDLGCWRAHWSYAVVGTSVSAANQSAQRCVHIHD